MPGPVDYSKGVIYKIARRDGTGECYVGSTTNLRQRRSSHKSTCCNPNSAQHNLPVYQHIRANGGWSDWEVAPIEQWSCASKQELEIRERHWIDELKPQLNSYKPAGYALAGGMAQYQKDWREVNKEYQKQYSKQYYQQHADELKEYHKQYRAEHAEEKKQYAAERIECECGAVVSRGCIARHRKSAKHQWVMQQISENISD